MAISNFLQFFALCYKDDAALYFPDGQTRAISCQHVNEGTYGVNLQGQAFALPTSTNVPITSSPPDPTEYEAQTALVQGGNVYYGKDKPFAVGDNYKVCVKVKDPKTGRCTYIDAESYATNVVTCNPVD